MQTGDSLSQYTGLRIHAVFTEDVLNILNINISGQNVLPDRQGGGNTGGLSVAAQNPEEQEEMDDEE